MLFCRVPETFLRSMWPIYAKDYPPTRYTALANVCVQNTMRFPQFYLLAVVQFPFTEILYKVCNLTVSQMGLVFKF